jgi:DNA (cytosine-5)-methyltransferase 1
VVRPFLSAYYSPGTNASVDSPAPTLTTKDRVAVVLPELTDETKPAWEIRAEDTPAMRRIKEFCALYGIVDVTMRMLRISEMKRIQGFGDDYVLVGTQEEQKKYLGNAVVTQVATALCEALAEALSEQAAGRVAS